MSTEIVRTPRDGEPRTSTSTFTQLLSSAYEVSVWMWFMTLPCAHLNVQSVQFTQTSDSPPKTSGRLSTQTPDIQPNPPETIYPNINSTRQTFHPNTRQAIYPNTRHPAQSTQQTFHPNTQQTIYPNTRHPAQSTWQTFQPNTRQTIYLNTRHPAQSTRQTIHPNIQKTTIPHTQPNPPKHPKDDPTTHPAQPTRQTITCTPNRCCTLETTHSVTFDRQSRNPPDTHLSGYPGWSPSSAWTTLIPSWWVKPTALTRGGAGPLTLIEWSGGSPANYGWPLAANRRLLAGISFAMYTRDVTETTVSQDPCKHCC